jgi:hypothetical protein
VVKPNKDEAGKVILILIVWSAETPRYPVWLQRIWQSHSRHADLKKVSSQEAPKHPEILGRAIRRAPYREAFITDVKFWEVFRTGEGKDGVVRRSSDLTRMTTEPEEGLAT